MRGGVFTPQSFSQNKLTLNTQTAKRTKPSPLPTLMIPSSSASSKLAPVRVQVQVRTAHHHPQIPSPSPPPSSSWKPHLSKTDPALQRIFERCIPTTPTPAHPVDRNTPACHATRSGKANTMARNLSPIGRSVSRCM